MKQIPLTRGYVALVDDEDFERLNAFEWYAHNSTDGKRVYARRMIRLGKGKWKDSKMHQEILGVKWADHADGNGLNNQRYNLRKSTRSQNGANQAKLGGMSSSFKGVYRSKGRWCAQVRKDGKPIHLGYFADEVDAATVYNFAAYEIWGEFARMNTPPEAELDQYKWRPISEIHEDFGPCVLMRLDDPGYMEIGSNLNTDFDESKWTHFAEVPKLTITEAEALDAAIKGALAASEPSTPK